MNAWDLLTPEEKKKVIADRVERREFLKKINMKLKKIGRSLSNYVENNSIKSLKNTIDFINLDEDLITFNSEKFPESIVVYRAIPGQTDLEKILQIETTKDMVATTQDEKIAEDFIGDNNDFNKGIIIKYSVPKDGIYLMIGKYINYMREDILYEEDEVIINPKKI